MDEQNRGGDIGPTDPKPVTSQWSTTRPSARPA